jgi:hypothetical protein
MLEVGKEENYIGVDYRDVLQCKNILPHYLNECL